MKTLNLYIIRKVLINWTLILFGIILLVIIGDMAGHIKHITALYSKVDGFIPFAKELADYYLNDQLPSWLSTFLPIAALSSVTLLVLQFKRHHEWVAMASGNLSVGGRMFLPLLILSIISSTLYYLNQERWLPQLRHVSLKDRPMDQSDNYTQLNGINVGDQGRLQCVWYKKNVDTVHDIILIVPEKYIIKAKEAKWTRKGWQMKDVIRYQLLDNAKGSEESHHDHWLWPSTLSLKTLDELSRKHEYLSRRQLKKIAKKFPKERTLAMDAHFRVIKYFETWVLLFLGFPFVMSGANGVICALRGVLAFLIVYVLYIAVYKMGVGGMPIILSCALAPTLGLIIGTYFWKKMPQ